MVEGFVVLGEELSTVTVEERGSQRDRDLDGLHVVADDEARRFDGHADLLREMNGAGEVGMRHQDHDLLAAVACDRVRFTGGVVHDGRQTAEDLVTRGMPVCIIEHLEIADVHESGARVRLTGSISRVR